MTCEEARVLVHALIDGELDAGHTREVENHIANCPECASALAHYQELRQTLRGANLRYAAPDALRSRIEAAIPVPAVRAPMQTRRSLLQGFALGTAMSAMAATGIGFFVVRSAQDERVLGDVVSAHLRSLQAEHLTDVLSTDQHTVKPWFNGKLPVAPPVPDLTTQGFTLLGGRLDYIDGKPVAALVYRRRVHIINLFVAASQNLDRAPGRGGEMIQGFSVQEWTDQGLRFIAISDIGADELQEFRRKFAAGAIGSN